MVAADRPLRNASARSLLAFFATSVFTGLVVPALVFARGPDMYKCEEGLPNSGWCATNSFDVGVTHVLAHAPLMTGLSSHLFTLVACPMLGLSSVLAPLRRAQAGMPRAHAHQDAVIWGSTQLLSLGANTVAKKGLRRQRPCYHFGREGETEAALLPNQQWVSCYSGDTAMAWSFIVAAVALAAARGRTNAAELAKLGAKLAGIGSVLRVVGLMHWTTDVLLGVFFGCLIGGGVPTLVFRHARDGDGDREGEGGEKESLLGLRGNGSSP